MTQLNLSPTADGTIPRDQRDCLSAFGDWLKRNGEAVYATRPWLEFGEGPTRMAESGSHLKKALQYTANDIRYTRSKDGRTLYAITMGTPSGTLAPSILQINSAADDVRVELLHPRQGLRFGVENGRLAINVPDDLPTDFAYALKLTGFNIALTCEAQSRRDTSLRQLQNSPIAPGKKHHDNIMFGAGV